MSVEVGSYTAKTKLPEILRQVEKGESFTITNHGKPVADLIPSRSSDRLRTKAAIHNLLQIQRVRISDSVLIELKSDGRK